MISTLTLSDGRALQWADNDIESDSALVLHHGTTIAMDIWNSWLSVARDAGVRAIAFNRPGLGLSTRKQGRLISDDVADARELIEQLQLTSFVSIGWSGGGARALGTALIDGCVGVHTVAGISPINLYDPTTFAGISPERIERLKEYVADFSEIVRDRGATFEEDMNFTAERALEILSTLPSFSDHEDQYRAFAKDFEPSVLNALGNGIEIDADDYRANISPWGFALNDVQQPVTIWHGDQDEDVLMSRGEYNHQHLPHSVFKPLAGQGHVSIMVEARAEIMASAIETLKSGSR